MTTVTPTQPAKILDARVFGKLVDFDGTEQSWMNYKYVFESYIGTIGQQMQSEILAAAFAPGIIPLANMTPEVQSPSKSLFTAFVLTWKKP